MTRARMFARGVPLVGSVPLESSEAVFRAAGSILGNRLRRVPDGETGERHYWIHLPVPRDRTDDAYFAPRQKLELHPETELHLGLVHATGGREGMIRRIEAARRTVTDSGVATECGMRRRPPETIPDLLQIHAEVASFAI